MYQAQFKIRRQKPGESIQELEARVAYIAFTTAPADMMECQALQTFTKGIRDIETQQTVRLARLKALADALATALEFEANREAEALR